MRLPNYLPRTVAELCSHPEVQHLLMQTFAAAYSLHLLDCEDPSKYDANKVWWKFIDALRVAYINLDDELFEHKNYSPVRNT
jgi:hypothetical protein